MTNSAAVLAVMLRLPQFTADAADSPEERAELYRPVAEAIAAASRTVEQEAFLIAQGNHDSHFARYVLEYRCKDGKWHCDDDRSRGAFQVGFWCKSRTIEGEARCALKAAYGGVERCREHSLTPAHAMFAGTAARECSWPGANKRVETYHRVLRRLRGESAEKTAKR